MAIISNCSKLRSKWKLFWLVTNENHIKYFKMIKKRSLNAFIYIFNQRTSIIFWSAWKVALMRVQVSCMWCWSISAEAFLWLAQILAARMNLKCLYFVDKKIKGCGNCRPLPCRWGLGRVFFVSIGRMWDLQVCFTACSTIHLWAACSWQHVVNVFHNAVAKFLYTSPLSMVLKDWLYGHLTCLLPRAIYFWSMVPIIKATAVLDRAIT